MFYDSRDVTRTQARYHHLGPIIATKNRSYNEKKQQRRGERTYHAARSAESQVQGLFILWLAPKFRVSSN